MQGTHLLRGDLVVPFARIHTHTHTHIHTCAFPFQKPSRFIPSVLTIVLTIHLCFVCVTELPSDSNCTKLWS